MSFFSTKKILAAGLAVLGMSMTSTLTGCLTDSKKDTTKTDTAHHTAWTTEQTVAVGAQGHPTLGSVLDLDTPEALLSADANAQQEFIDIVFMFYGGAFHMDGPVAARAAGVANSINLTNTYDLTRIKDIKFVKVTAKPADQEAGRLAYESGTPVNTTVITGGELFVVKTTDNAYVYVKVASITGTDKFAASSFVVSIGTI